MNLDRVVSKAHQLAHIPRVTYYKFHLDKKKEEQHVQIDVVLLSQKQRNLGSDVENVQLHGAPCSSS